jgi:hypothetical protein
VRHALELPLLVVAEDERVGASHQLERALVGVHGARSLPVGAAVLAECGAGELAAAVGDQQPAVR